jgi:hypothetical protein
MMILRVDVLRSPAGEPSGPGIETSISRDRAFQGRGSRWQRLAHVVSHTWAAGLGLRDAAFGAAKGTRPSEPKGTWKVALRSTARVA